MQIENDFVLNDTTAPGNYDVAGAFMWSVDLCANDLTPECQGGGGGGAFGGFGGFGAVVPEPSTGLLMMSGLLWLARSGRRAV